VVVPLAAALGVLAALEFPAGGRDIIAFLIHPVPLGQAAPAADIYVQSLPLACIGLMALGLDIEDQHVPSTQRLDLRLTGQGALHLDPGLGPGDHSASPPNGSSALSWGASAGLSGVTISTAG